MNLDNLFTPTQAADELNINPSLVRRYCRQGRLGQKIGGRYLITRHDLERFKAIPRKAGKPKRKE